MTDAPSRAATPSRPPAFSRRLAIAIATAAVVALILAGAAFYAKSRDVGVERIDPGNVLFDGSVAVPAGGTAVRVRVRRPARLTFDVRAPAEVAVSFGVPKPPPATGGRPENDVPVDGSAAWAVAAGAGPHEEHVYATGLYVLRITATAATTAAVRVTEAPPR